jgi:uncharacterized membrane protein YphA (DoxX/SURF4 family)
VTHTRSGAPLGWLVLAARVIVAALFIFAGYIKISDPQQFAFSVNAFKLLPEHLVILSTFAMPWMELIAGVMLLAGVWTRAAAAVISAMLVAFIFGITSVIYREMDVSCGCFGKFEIPCKGSLGVCHLVRNGVMLAMAGLVVLKGPGPLTFDRAKAPF